MKRLRLCALVTTSLGCIVGVGVSGALFWLCWVAVFLGAAAIETLGSSVHDGPSN